nr:D-alanyl-D-alanine endopeptidase [Zoogloeaceae bacterium]
MNYRALLVVLIGLVFAQVGVTQATAATAPAKQASAKSTTKAASKPAPRATTKAKVKAKSKAKTKPKAKVAAKPKKKSSASVRRAAAVAAVPQAAESEIVSFELDRAGNPVLASSAFVVVNQKTGAVIAEKRAEAPMPIASITKLMTAMVVLDSRQSLSEMLTISADDVDDLKGTGSRIAVGTRLTREEMLRLALMSSENRAASALGRHYPGGRPAFIMAMNIKARMIGLWDTRFADSTGLNPANVSSPSDLVKMVQAAAAYPLIREFSTTPERYVTAGSRTLHFRNSNGLVRDPDWQVGLSKTGYIREAGRCLVMQTWVHGAPVIMVFMDSQGKYTRVADARRVKRWLETSGGQRLATVQAQASGT